MKGVGPGFDGGERLVFFPQRGNIPAANKRGKTASIRP
jgi:hypothetical protein